MAPVKPSPYPIQPSARPTSEVRRKLVRNPHLRLVPIGKCSRPHTTNPPEPNPFGIGQAGCVGSPFARKLGASGGRPHQRSRVNIRHSPNACGTRRLPNRQHPHPVMKRGLIPSMLWNACAASNGACHRLRRREHLVAPACPAMTGWVWRSSLSALAPLCSQATRDTPPPLTCQAARCLYPDGIGSTYLSRSCAILRWCSRAGWVLAAHAFRSGFSPPLA